MVSVWVPLYRYRTAPGIGIFVHFGTGLAGCRIVRHLKDLYEGGEGFTLHFNTAGDGEGYILRVCVAYLGQRYTLHVHTVYGDDGYIQPSTPTLMVV
jgi:hypothetical protein